MRGGHSRKIGMMFKVKQFAQFLGVLVSGRPVVAVVDPEHRNVRLRLHCQMQMTAS